MTKRATFVDDEYLCVPPALNGAFDLAYVFNHASSRGDAGREASPGVKGGA